MIAYEIQLRYVIRDRMRDKIQSEKKNIGRNILLEEKLSEIKIVSDIVSDFQCAK